LAGLVLAGIGQYESLKVIVSQDNVRLVRKGATQDIPRDSIAAAFLDRKELVLLGQQDEELAREPSDLNGKQLEDTFRQHDCPWLAEDPHRDEFRRWVPDSDGLPPGANALLKAREKGEDLAELRAELAKLGVVVRDEKKRQYWRRTTSG
jgi:hypothetical protein